MHSEYLKFAMEIATEAKKIMLKYFNAEKSSKYKSDNTIVTIADYEINDYLVSRVQEAYPNHSVSGEEGSFGESNHVWVCDPIDGTAMYARHIQAAVFSLALVVNGEPIIGVVCDPFNNDLYTAVRNHGAFKNAEQIFVNNKHFEKGSLRTVSHYDMWPNAPYDLYPVIQDLSEKTYFVSIGSVIRACMAVATGEFHAVIFPGVAGKHVDAAASKLIVEEAGGLFTDIFGNNQRYDQDINGFVASNGLVHDEIIRTIKKHID